MPPKKSQKTEKSVETPLSMKTKKELIIRLLNGQKIDWKIEGGIVKRLYNKYPYPEFWTQFNIPHFFTSFTSFRVFTTGWGAEYLNKNFNLWFSQNQKIDKEIELKDIKLGEDVKINTSPKTIKDFLK